MGEVRLEVVTTGLGSKTEVRSGKHHFYIDEPTSLGGTDAGPNPLQYVLGALAGCEEVVANQVAKQMGFQLDGIDFDIMGFIDPRGMMGQDDVVPYFQHITIRASVKTPESTERIRELQEMVDKRCPVLTLIHAAGVKVDTEWRSVASTLQ